MSAATGYKNLVTALGGGSALTGTESVGIIQGGVAVQVQASYLATAALFNGTLPVSKGGTGATTLTGYVSGSGTGALTASATIPTSALTGTFPAGSISGTLAVANGGTGVATSTGTGAAVLNNAPALTSPSISSGASFNGSSSGAVVVRSAATTANYNLTLPASAGTNGYVLATDGSGTTSWIANTGAGGTVTSVNIAVGATGLTATGGPITGSGSITLGGVLVPTNGGTGAATLTGYVYGNGTSTMTASTTIPTSALSGTFPAGSISGTLGVANGGTGLTTLTGVAYGNGSSAMSAATAAQIVAVIGSTPVANATLATSANGLTGTFPAGSLSGTVSVANGGTGATTLTGLVYGNGTSAMSAATAAQVVAVIGSTAVTSATTASALNTGNNYQVNSIGVGGSAPGTAGQGEFYGDAFFASSYNPTSTLSIGFRGLPQNSQSIAYPCVLSDAGKHIRLTGTGGASVPGNGTVAYPIGTTLTFVNTNALAVPITVTDTTTLANTALTGSRTLASYGLATALKIGTTEWIISGAGLT